MPHKIHECETCTPADAHIYEPVELNEEGKAVNPDGKFERYKQVRPALIEHRMAVETELRRAVKGNWPPPHIIMDRLLQLGIPIQKCEFQPTDEVLLKFGADQKKPKKKGQEKVPRIAEVRRSSVTSELLEKNMPQNVERCS